MKRILLSGIVLVACVTGRQIQLPGIELRPEWAGAMPFPSIMALGLMPLLSGYILVEFAALLVPGLRRLRVGPPEGRAHLHRAAVITAVVLSLIQSIVFVTGLEGQSMIVRLDVASRMVVVLALVGAVVAQAAMARMLDREGLGHGFAILLLSVWVPSTWDHLWHAFRDGEAHLISAWVLPVIMLVMAAAAGATLWLFSSRRIPAPGEPHPSLLSRPACGLAPLSTVFKIFRVAPALMVVSGIDRPPDLWFILLLRYWYIAALLSAGLAIVFAYLFNPPARVAQMWARLAPNPPEGVPHPRNSYKESAWFMAGLMIIGIWACRSVGAPLVDVAGVVLLTGIGCDLVREWRARRARPDLVPVWEIHQCYAVPPTIRCLEAEGIPAFARGERLRALLQFFGPYAPIHILVPNEHAPRAHALLRERWSLV